VISSGTRSSPIILIEVTDLLRCAIGSGCRSINNWTYPSMLVVDGNRQLKSFAGVARQQVTFLVLPRKVTKRGRPRCAAPAGFPRYFANKRGCATRPGGAHKTCPTAELGQCSPKSPLVCEISRRRTGEGKTKFKTTKRALRAHSARLVEHLKKGIEYEQENKCVGTHSSAHVDGQYFCRYFP